MLFLSFFFLNKLSLFFSLLFFPRGTKRRSVCLCTAVELQCFCTVCIAHSSSPNILRWALSHLVVRTSYCLLKSYFPSLLLFLISKGYFQVQSLCFLLVISMNDSLIVNFEQPQGGKAGQMNVRLVAVVAVAAAAGIFLCARARRRAHRKFVPLPILAGNTDPRIQPAEVVVGFASCGGTAEGMARILWSECVDRGVEAILLQDDVAHTATEIIQSAKVVLLIVATSGEGQMPCSFSFVVRALKAVTPKERAGAARGEGDCRRVAVLGLGDSSYRHYCKAARDVVKIFEVSSAQWTPLVGNTYLTLCDASGPRGHQEEVFADWSREVFSALRSLGGGSILSRSVGEPSVGPPRRRYTFHELEVETRVGDPFLAPLSTGEPSLQRPAFARIAAAVKCYPATASAQVVHLVLDTSPYPGLTYEAGDHLGVIAPNPESEVANWLQWFGVPTLEWHRPCEVTSRTVSKARATANSVFPVKVTTLWNILKWYVDISQPPRLSSVLHAIRCATTFASEEDKRQACALAPQLLRKAFEDAGGKVTLLSFLVRYFPLVASAQLKLLIEGLPSLQPRFYSIASDGLSHRSEVHIFVRVVDLGLASTYLSSEGLHGAFVFIRPSAFHLPRQVGDKPMIMIGPGTGIAPLIGFLHRITFLVAEAKRRATHHPAQLSKLANTGRVVMLFHGCRTVSEWCHYLKDDIVAKFLRQSPSTITSSPGNMHCAEGVLDVCSVSVSREANSPREYVTDALWERRTDIYRMLVEGQAYVFVCGDAKRMAKDVRAKFIDILKAVGGFSQSSAEELIASMVQRNRYLEDVW